MSSSLRSVIAFALVSAVGACAFAPSASAFSREGYESVALLAYSSKDLSPSAKAAIDGILGSESIAFSAEWPDAIKPPFGSAANTPEAIDFTHKHPGHHSWHFVNFPIGSTAYTPTSPYAKADDISHAIQGCVAVLEGKGTFDNLSKKEALRYLVHLVADVHQPLHTAFEQFDVSNPTHPVLLKGTPTTPPGAMMDGGGNDLYYDGKNELHAFWDDDIVTAIIGSNNTEKLVAALQPDVSKKLDLASGDYHLWVNSWLGESMRLVGPAFAGIKYNAMEVETSSGGRTSKRINITLPDTYEKDNIKVARLQVTRAASHLLQLFNAMKWSH